MWSILSTPVGETVNMESPSQAGYLGVETGWAPVGLSVDVDKGGVAPGVGVLVATRVGVAVGIGTVSVAGTGVEVGVGVAVGTRAGVVI